jgi:transcription initiation factor IIF auxiliary subunit
MLLQVGASANTHRWTFFVRMDTPSDDERFIKGVIVKLHRTFQPPTVALAQPPFEVR